MSTEARPFLQGGAAPPPYGASEHWHRENHSHNHGHHHRVHHQHQHHQHHHQHYQHHHTHSHLWRHEPHAHFYPMPVVVQPRSLGPAVVVHDRGRPRCRFCKTFLFAIVIWFLICAVARSSVYDPPFGRRPRWGVGPPSRSPDYPIPAGVNLLACEEPLRNGGPSQTSFEVESLDDPVFLLSGGTSLHGSVAITTSTVRDSVKISVDLSSASDRHADTIVCSLKRRDGGHGVGIFNPKRVMHDNNGVKYDVIVEFPENHPIVKQFETNVVNAIHDIDDLYGKILFERLTLRGSNGAIKSKSLFAEWAEIHTINGPVQGYFNVSDHFSIATLNGFLDVDVDFNQNSSSKALLSLSTTNAPLKANLKLHDLTSSRGVEPSKFQVVTQTLNGRLDASFLDAPLDSILNYRASTSNQPAAVMLHPTFEGGFTLASNSPWFTPSVYQHNPDDPAGRGRKRVVRFDSHLGRVRGEAYWAGSSSTGKGEVDISTSNARVMLDL